MEALIYYSLGAIILVMIDIQTEWVVGGYLDPCYQQPDNATTLFFIHNSWFDFIVYQTCRRL